MARITVAEDEEAAARADGAGAHRFGHDVVTAVDGADALDILTRENGRFELLRPTSRCR
jgi:CheY-like chemotaxis protein